MIKKVLIIDDEKNIRMTIKQCLDESAYQVDVAVNGEEGYRRNRNTKHNINGECGTRNIFRYST